jgi:hypothetical protein
VFCECKAADLSIYTTALRDLLLDDKDLIKSYERELTMKASSKISCASKSKD